MPQINLTIEEHQALTQLLSHPKTDKYRSGAEFAEQIASDCGYVKDNLPSWIEINWEKTWDNLS